MVPLAVVLVALALAGPAAAAEETRWTCGPTPPLPLGVLLAPGNAEAEDNPAAAALREWAAAKWIGFAQPAKGWKVVARGPEQVTWIHSQARMNVGAAPDATGAWKVHGWGGCAFTRALPGRRVVPLTLQHRFTPGPRTRRLGVTIEAGCPPRRDLVLPRLLVEESERAVRVVMSVYPSPPTNVPCPAIPMPVARTVTLPTPLGNRRLIDASTHPAVRVWPKPSPPQPPR